MGQREHQVHSEQQSTLLEVGLLDEAGSECLGMMVGSENGWIHVGIHPSSMLSLSIMGSTGRAPPFSF